MYILSFCLFMFFCYSVFCIFRLCPPVTLSPFWHFVFSVFFCLYVILSKNNYVILSKNTTFAVIMAVFILEIII